jgi:hypothetical protein
VNHLFLASSVTIGRVKAKAMMTSMMVVNPRTNAKPRTAPTDK